MQTGLQYAQDLPCKNVGLIFKIFITIFRHRIVSPITITSKPLWFGTTLPFRKGRWPSALSTSIRFYLKSLWTLLILCSRVGSTKHRQYEMELHELDFHRPISGPCANDFRAQPTHTQKGGFSMLIPSPTARVRRIWVVKLDQWYVRDGA